MNARFFLLAGNRLPFRLTGPPASAIVWVYPYKYSSGGAYENAGAKGRGFLEWGGIQKEIALLAVSGAALVASIFDLLPLPFDAAWVAICSAGVPIVLEALIGPDYGL